MLSDIVREWFVFPTIYACFTHWKSFFRSCTYSLSSHLRVLLFNVRGLGVRWEEVLLLSVKYEIDCLVLTEVGAVQWDTVKQAFTNFKLFYQKGENSRGGVLMLFKNSLSVERVKCDTPNVCVVEVKLEKTTRLIGMYAPKSKSWNWDVLSSYITDDCCLCGDFNVDFESKSDKKAAKNLLEWADGMLLTAVIPNDSTSLRSDRTIDYAFIRGRSITLQACTDNTTSDHKPTQVEYARS